MCFKTSHDPIKYLQVNGPIQWARGSVARAHGGPDATAHHPKSQYRDCHSAARHPKFRGPETAGGARQRREASGLRVASGSVGDVAPSARSTAAHPKMVVEKLDDHATVRCEMTRYRRKNMTQGHPCEHQKTLPEHVPENADGTTDKGERGPVSDRARQQHTRSHPRRRRFPRPTHFYRGYMWPEGFLTHPMILT